MIAETFTHNNKTINIKYDKEAVCPRSWDNLGTMVCFTRNYRLGDKHDLTSQDLEAITKSNEYISLPLYLYDHSGLTMNTTGFSCSWDSGCVGAIFVSKYKICKEYGWKYITQKRKEQIIGYLNDEVESYDQFLRGDIYGYEILDSDGNVEDFCWGFFGKEFAISEAKACT